MFGYLATVLLAAFGVVFGFLTRRARRARRRALVWIGTGLAALLTLAATALLGAVLAGRPCPGPT
jgi:hypothetical protein